MTTPAYSVVYSDDFLAHHGVKGQKWGIRNYQNEDGSYTAKGRGRYSDGKPHYGRHDRMNSNDSRDSAVTRRVKADYNNLSNREFKAKYQTSRNTYRHRVNRRGDPYANRSAANKAMLGAAQKYANSSLGKHTINTVHNSFRKRDQYRATARDLLVGMGTAKIAKIASAKAAIAGKTKLSGLLQMGAGAIQIGTAAKIIKDNIDISNSYKSSRKDVDKALKKESKQIDEIRKK